MSSVGTRRESVPGECLRRHMTKHRNKDLVPVPARDDFIPAPNEQLLVDLRALIDSARQRVAKR